MKKFYLIFCFLFSNATMANFPIKLNYNYKLVDSSCETCSVEFFQTDSGSIKAKLMDWGDVGVDYIKEVGIEGNYVFIKWKNQFSIKLKAVSDIAGLIYFFKDEYEGYQYRGVFISKVSNPESFPAKLDTVYDLKKSSCSSCHITFFKKGGRIMASLKDWGEPNNNFIRKVKIIKGDIFIKWGRYYDVKLKRIKNTPFFIYSFLDDDNGILIPKN